MGDKNQPQSAMEEGRTLDWPHKKVRVTKIIEVELEGFPDVRLQEMAEEAQQELGLDISHQLKPVEPALPTATTAPRGPARINPEPREQIVDWPSPLLTLAIGAVVLGVSVDFLVSKGFDTILAAAQSREGAIGVGRAMGEYLKALAPFVRVVFDGSILGGLAYKVWKRGRRPRRSR